MDAPVREYFPELDPGKLDQLERLEAVFRDWNQRINLVSRKDMDAFALHHLVHSLALTKFVDFPPRCRILDVGTGGGLPGLPLAICSPDAQVHLCDSITKKAKAVEDMIGQLRLANAHAVNKRAETLESRWDFILGRAVTSLPRFISWVRGNIRKGNSGSLPNGILYWKGSLYKEELETLGLEPYAVYPIEEKIPHPYFAGKYIVHLDWSTVQKLKLPED